MRRLSIPALDMRESVKAPGWLLYRTRNAPTPSRISSFSASGALRFPWNHLHAAVRMALA